MGIVADVPHFHRFLSNGFSMITADEGWVFSEVFRGVKVDILFMIDGIGIYENVAYFLDYQRWRGIERFSNYVLNGNDTVGFRNNFFTVYI